MGGRAGGRGPGTGPHLLMPEALPQGSRGPGGADGGPSAGWGTWAWSSSACPSCSPASSFLASFCSPASCSCTTSTSPSCSSPTWSTSPGPAPAAHAGPTGAPAPASEGCGLWSWLVGVGGCGSLQKGLVWEGKGGWRGSDGGTQGSGKALAVTFKCQGASGRGCFL